MNWYLNSVCILILSAISILLMKHLSNNHSSESMMCYMISVVLTGVVALAYICPRTKQLMSLNGAWSSIWGLTLISFISWVLWGRAIRDAPNPGYVNAIVNANVIITVIISAFLFGDHLTAKSLIGCVVVVFGLALVASSLK